MSLLTDVNQLATDAALMKDKVKTAFAVPLDRAILYPIARTAATSHTRARSASAGTSSL